MLVSKPPAGKPGLLPVIKPRHALCLTNRGTIPCVGSTVIPLDADKTAPATWALPRKKEALVQDWSWLKFYIRFKILGHFKIWLIVIIIIIVVVMLFGFFHCSAGIISICDLSGNDLRSAHPQCCTGLQIHTQQTAARGNRTLLSVKGHYKEAQDGALRMHGRKYLNS